jgi:RNA polymerase sigma factor (sigma-70 family)
MMTRMEQVFQHLRRVGCRLTDGQLLERFVRRRECAALELLVQRHGPMVWAVCRRILPNYHDAEDAFQATFLVLARKASSVKPREMVGNWLYGVARQTAMKARATTAKQRARERQVPEMPEPAVTERDARGDFQPFLDEELSRLPDKYRVAIVLCDLEGRTRKEVAQQLGCPEGTLAARLTRGRAMLAKRLVARGLTLSTAALTGSFSRQVQAVPMSVMSSTLAAMTLVAAGEAVSGVVSANAIALAEGVVRTMLRSKIKIVTATLLLVAILGGGMVGLTNQTPVIAGDDPPLPVAPVQVASNERNAELANEAEEPDEPVRQDSLDGKWDDVEHEGAWFRFQGSMLTWHPNPSQRREDAVKPVTEKWTCRYDLTQTPMTIDLFHKKGTDRGIFVVERGTLFVALARTGEARPTKIQRDNDTTLLVLRRAKPKTGGPVLDIAHAFLVRVDVKEGKITAAVPKNTSDEYPLQYRYWLLSNKGAGDLNLTGPRLVDIPVRLEGGKNALRLTDLQPGQVVSLQLACDTKSGLTVIGIHADKKP